MQWEALRKVGREPVASVEHTVSLLCYAAARPIGVKTVVGAEASGMCRDGGSISEEGTSVSACRQDRDPRGWMESPLRLERNWWEGASRLSVKRSGAGRGSRGSVRECVIGVKLPTTRTLRSPRPGDREVTGRVECSLQ